MLKTIITICSLLLTVSLIAACGNSSTPAAQPGTVKVALIVTGSTSDHGWNQLAAESLAAVAKDQNVETIVLQNVTPDKAADQIRQCEAKGFNLVILHGNEYQPAAQDVTDPAKATATKVKIAVSGGDVDNPNFQSILYDLTPASYELGIIAAKTSASGKIGFIAGEKIPTVTTMQRGYEAGAKSVNPNITVTAVYTDSWDNPAIAKTKAEGLIAQGVDVIMQNVDAASTGVFEAVKEYNQAHSSNGEIIQPDGTRGMFMVRHVYTFGANSDQNNNPICPDYTLASAVIKMDACFGKVTKSVKDGTFKGGVVHEDLANGHALAVLNPALIGKVISPETQKLVDDAAKKLAAGEIKLPQ